MKDGVIENPFFKDEDGCICCIVFMIIIGVGLFFGNIYTYGTFGGNWYAIIFFNICSISIFFTIYFIISAGYCENCKKRVYPLVFPHRCELVIQKKEGKIENKILVYMKNDIKQVKKEINSINLFNNEKNLQNWHKFIQKVCNFFKNCWNNWTVKMWFIIVGKLLTKT